MQSEMIAFVVYEGVILKMQTDTTKIKFYIRTLTDCLYASIYDGGFLFNDNYSHGKMKAWLEKKSEHWFRKPNNPFIMSRWYYSVLFNPEFIYSLLKATNHSTSQESIQGSLISLVLMNEDEK